MVGDGTGNQRPVAGENGQRSEILGAREELPFERFAHLGGATLDPRADPLPQDHHLVGRSESLNDVAAGLIDAGRQVQSLTSCRRRCCAGYGEGVPRSTASAMASPIRSRFCCSSRASWLVASPTPRRKARNSSACSRCCAGDAALWPVARSAAAWTRLAW